MALGLSRSGSGGDFIPSLRYHCGTGEFIIAKRVKDESDKWDTVQTEISIPEKFIFDLENIEVGWLVFSAQMVDTRLVKLGEPFPDKPSEKHKKGFRVKVYNKKYGLAAFSPTAGIVHDAMDELHNVYKKDFKANEGKLPVVEITGTKKIVLQSKEGKSTYKQPIWKIVSWVEKPEGMKEQDAPVQESVVEEAEDNPFA